ncbi:MAG: S8 family serine peptidase [Caldisericia bacterium]|nr:S8 family serine peptidase [Caldisericia bacterium]
MKKILVFFLSLSLLISSFSVLETVEVTSQEQYCIENQLINIESGSINNIIENLKIAKKQGWVIDWKLFQHMNIIQVTGDAELTKELFSGMTARLIPNLTVAASPIVKKASINKLPAKDWNLKDLKIRELWEKGYTGKGVKIGILDTGCDGTHPQLQGKIKNFAYIGRNGVAEVSEEAFDTDIHGTHVSGIAAGGSIEDPLGVAPEANLLVGIVIPGGMGSFSQIIGGIEWAIDPDLNPATKDSPSIINMSLGMPGFVDFWSPVFEKALNNDILIVSSSGNEGNGISNSPGNHPEVVGVGSYNVNRKPSSFSAGDADIKWDGTYIKASPYIKPDISAPGSAIYSSIPGNSYEYFSGTSMSSPHVAGAAAILKQVNPTATAWDLRNMLIWGAEDLGVKGWDTRFGNGALDIESSLSLFETAKQVNGTIENYTPDYSIWIPEINSGMYILPDGSFSGKLIPGTYTVQIKKGKKIIHKQTILVDDQDLALYILMPEIRLMEFSGVVFNQNGISIENAKIIHDGKVYRTDKNGHFKLNLYQGDDVIIRQSGFKEQRFVANEKKQWVNVRLRKVSLLLIEGFSPYSTTVNPPQQALFYYEEALNALNKDYALFKCSEETLTYEDMEGFQSAILFYSSGGMLGNEVIAAGKYLDMGGRLLVSGRMVLLIEQFYHRTFLTERLQIYSKNMLAFPSVKGIGSEYEGFKFPLSGSGGANNQETCDVIMKEQESKSTPILTYSATSATKYAGILSNTGQYKLGFFGFGVEGIGIKNDRISLLETIFEWMNSGGSISISKPATKTYITIKSKHETFEMISKESKIELNNLFLDEYTFKLEQYGKEPVYFECNFKTENNYLANVFFKDSKNQSVSINPLKCDLESAFLMIYYKDTLLSSENIDPRNSIKKELPSGDYLFCISAKGYKNQYYKMDIYKATEENRIAEMKMKKSNTHVLMIDDSATGWALLDRYLQIGIYSSRWMESTGIVFDFWSVEDRGFPLFHELYPYDVIIDVAGRNTAALYTENRQETISKYLDHNGSFAIFENSTHAVMDNSKWLSNYFGVEISNANIREKTVTGVENTVTQGMYFDLFNPVEQDGLYITFPELKFTKDETKTLFFYASQKVCSSYYDSGSFRTALVPFGVDNLMHSETRLDLLKLMVKLMDDGTYDLE